MAVRSDGLQTEKRILQACVRLFLENGYHQTTMTQILKEAQVSSSSFQNLFHSKDGILMELVKFMFENQFGIARSVTGAALPPVYVYAAETALQITLTELNQNLRDIYLEAYTQDHLLGYIQRATTKELYRIFGPYQPELTERDFYELEFGSAGLMRGYMANPCTAEFPLERKLERFLTLALRGYKVPEDEVRQVLAFLAGLDMRGIAQRVMEELFRQLAMRYEFSPDGLLPPEE
ncbi:TetR/AcrR family transcriptional regulator [Anaeromassilibacillus senegalensis]|uniref:TetR/AcrR family transcriptional regulator n=1 Tax=Anaeromassilibacillus senegalensis TaxID=1673717 RepID=A0ABS9CMH0_9FIRM|nr:TetR/AcrR family transcriptional regulator [Anaeromassilibacillus senegalensis]MCF2651985.1 TetR/AcrR family transcriptional regulator [Anaeromassilibacillus senegalensis]MCI5651611.1 TetR/AcrR family transcriptional regulator [Ruminococcus bromii]